MDYELKDKKEFTIDTIIEKSKNSANLTVNELDFLIDALEDVKAKKLKEKR